MKTFIPNLKSRGFLSIGVSILIIGILTNFLLEYKLVINKTRRINAFSTTYRIDDEYENLSRFCYRELKRMDRKISCGIYKNPVAYVGDTSSGEKLWFLDSDKREGVENFSISRMKYNGITFYREKDNIKYRFPKLIKEQLYTGYKKINNLDIELIKRYRIDGGTGSILLTAIVTLEYREDSRNPFTPEREYLKEFVASFEDR